MKDRLIELIQQAHDGCVKISSQRLADYLLENGVVVPPCKVGDVIYMLVTRKTVCFEYPNGKMQRVENQHTFIKKTYLTKSNFFKVIDGFGKTIFLTKEVAKAKLALMQGWGDK